MHIRSAAAILQLTAEEWERLQGNRNALRERLGAAINYSGQSSCGPIRFNHNVPKLARYQCEREAGTD
jgi:hypothetical protein